MQTSSTPKIPRQAILSHRTLERLTAAILVFYCGAQVVTIVTRIASGADQPDALDSMAMISANHSWYLASKIANLVAAFLLLAASPLVFQVFRIHDRTLPLLAAVFLGAAGAFWLFSSLAGLALADILSKEAYGPSRIYYADDLSSQTTLYAFQAIEPVRAAAGRVGFTAAALGLAAWSATIVFAKPLPRWLGGAGWASAVAMFFIWEPEATAMHRAGGAALLGWLLVVAGLLTWKGTDRAEKAMPATNSDESQS